MTRSTVMFASVPAGSRLRTGQMVTVSILRPTVTGALNVPSSAIVKVGNRPAVFVRNKSGFTLVAVELRGSSPNNATISGSVTSKAQVATSGLPQLERILAGE
jgi:hypothetical protein